MIVTTKRMEPAIQLEIKQIINEGEIPMSNEKPPSKIVSTNNHKNVITYNDMLKGDKGAYNDNMMNSPLSSQKHPVSISY